MIHSYSTIHGMIMGGLRMTPIAQVTLEQIRVLAHGTCNALGDAEARARVEELVIAIQNEYGVVSMEGQTLRSVEDHRVWLQGERKARIRWTYWNAYRDFALDVPPSARIAIDRDTDKILEEMEDPTREGSWSTRGLIMGSVQSGKTANYIGLMAKAMDAGYRVIIVMTGIHESLRAQTQLRVNEGLLGYSPTVTGGKLLPVKDDSSKLPKGHPSPFCFTTANEGGDFNPAVAKLKFQQMIGQPGPPVIFIVKKNVRVLRNLFAWLSAVADKVGDRNVIQGVPALIIDDEADQATVDTAVTVDDNGEQYNDPTIINSLARGLCNLFDRSAYVAVTATPFANILIHKDSEGAHRLILTKKEEEKRRELEKQIEIAEKSGKPPESIRQLVLQRDQQGVVVFLGRDLFPRNFVYSLSPPSNYFGAEKFFGIANKDGDDGSASEALPIVGTVMDQSLRAGLQDAVDFVPLGRMDKSHKPKALPGSLRFAIRSFLISAAIRNLREPGFDRVNTMLVHATRFTAAQGEMKRLIENYLEQEVGNAVRNNQDFNASNAGRELKDAYDRGDFGVSGTQATSTAVCVRLGFSPRPIPGFEEIYAELRRMFSNPNCVVPVEVNGTSKDALIYRGKTDYSVIVVGGDKLSRGLTLNGLLVSYYLRSSNMYDSLMQMGRWFGYRESYVDLVRIFTTAELLERFAHIALAERVLRDDFDQLSATPNATPATFGLKILAHPEMTVSSPVKVRHGDVVEAEVSFGGQTSETTLFHLAHAKENALLVSRLADSTRDRQVSREKDGKVLCQGVDWRLIDGFLRQFRAEADDGSKKWGVYADYVKKLAQEEHELTEWTVVFRSSLSGDKNSKELVEQYPLSEFSPHLPDLRFPFARTLSCPPEGQRVRIKAAGGQLDEAIDLSDSQKLRAKELTAEWRARDRARRISMGLPVKDEESQSEYIGRTLRAVRELKNGILQLYPLVFRKREVDGGDHIGLEGIHWGFRLSFPGDASGHSISYVVNSVYAAAIAEDQQD